MAKIDGKKIIERLKKNHADRVKISLYLSEGLYSKFKRSCEEEGVSASQAMDELMKQFLTSIGVKYDE